MGRGHYFFYVPQTLRLLGKSGLGSESVKIPGFPSPTPPFSSLPSLVVKHKFQGSFLPDADMSYSCGTSASVSFCMNIQTETSRDRRQEKGDRTRTQEHSFEYTPYRVHFIPYFRPPTVFHIVIFQGLG